MDLGLTERAVLVAASSDGIGLAVAEEFLREGANVAICGRSKAKLAEAVSHLHDSTGRRPLATAVDLSDPSAAATWVEEAASSLGGVDVLFSSSGGTPHGRFTEAALEDFRAAYEQSVTSAVALAKAAHPFVKRSTQGRMIFLTAQVVKQPRPEYAVASVIKPGVVALAKILVGELALTGATVNVLAPGHIRTRRMENLLDLEDPSVMASKTHDIPLGRFGDPAEVAAAAVFLASQRAGYITGTVLQIDGGTFRGLL